MSNNEYNVISLGGGNQSSYMLITALRGKYGIKPDVAVFADTGSEPEYVYKYMEWLKTYVKSEFNFEIVTVFRGNLWEDVIKFTQGRKTRIASLPWFVKTETTPGPVIRQCTDEYKIRPVNRFISKSRNKRHVRKWIGISFDELQRQKFSSVKYMTHYYPLVEQKIRIDNILAFFQREGLPIPGKSACLMCPFHSDIYWKRLKANSLSEFHRVCEFDQATRNLKGFNQETFLHRSLKPLAEIDFTFDDMLFPEMIDECMGACGI